MRYLFMFLLIAGLGACSSGSSENTLVIGSISGPETELVEAARDVAVREHGLNIKVVEFSDYNLPNEALQDGSLDANVYQHLPYLKAAMKSHGYHFTVIGRTFVYPMAMYSEKYKSIADLPDSAVIAIPNDPSNEARALLLLQKSGLITLKKEEASSLSDVAGNPKKLKLKELDAAQLPRVLSDVDAAIINTTFAIPAGLDLNKDTIYVEDKNSPYANLIVIRNNSEKKEQLELFAKAFQSREVAEKAQQLFGGAAVPAW